MSRGKGDGGDEGDEGDDGEESGLHDYCVALGPLQMVWIRKVD